MQVNELDLILYQTLSHIIKFTFAACMHTHSRDNLFALLRAVIMCSENWISLLNIIIIIIIGVRIMCSLIFLEQPVYVIFLLLYDVLYILFDWTFVLCKFASLLFVYVCILINISNIMYIWFCFHFFFYNKLLDKFLPFCL